MGMNMSTVERYEGYIIEPSPNQLRDGGWDHELYVLRHGASGLAQKKFSTDAVFKTKREAVAACIAFGMEVIDGMVAKCAVENL